MKDHFKDKAQQWDANERRSAMSRAINDSINAHVDLHQDMSVLDFGAGTGLISAHIAPRVKRIVAVDTSQAMLEQLHKKDELKSKVETVCGDIVEQALDEQFDLIISAMAIHHVADTDKLMQRFHQHLNHDGQVALVDLDKEDGSFHKKGTEGVYHFGFDRKEFGALLKKNGFEAINFYTAHIVKGESKDYPLFLLTARKQDDTLNNA